MHDKEVEDNENCVSCSWLRSPLTLRWQFAEQFKEIKEAARLAREKSQERFELANPALNIAAPQVKHRSTSFKLQNNKLSSYSAWLERLQGSKWKLLLPACICINQPRLISCSVTSLTDKRKKSIFRENKNYIYIVMHFSSCFIVKHKYPNCLFSERWIEFP